MIPQIIPHRWSCVCLVAASAVLAAGCSLTPAYQRPAVSVPATFGSPQAASAPASDRTDANATTTVALNEQARAFLQRFAPDRDLRPLVERALAHNGDVRRAALQVEQARAHSGIAQRRDCRRSPSAHSSSGNISTTRRWMRGTSRTW